LRVTDVLSLWPWFAAAVAVVAALKLARRSHWRQVAAALYAQNAAVWQAQRTSIASGDPEPWRSERADTARREMEGFGFSFAGWIQNETFPRGATQPTQTGMSVCLGDGGTIWAASYEAGGHEVVEFESEFADGFVVSTGNNALVGQLAWPPSFDVRQQHFESEPAALVTLHRDRIAARLGARPGVPLVRCATLADVLASQERQRAVKGPFRRSVDFMTEEEFGHLATMSGLSRAATKGIYAEYRRVALEAREAGFAPGVGGPPRVEIDGPRTHGLITEALELHDSSLGALSVSGEDTILQLEQAYVHRWEREGGRWSGKGWIKPVRIRVMAASPPSRIPTLPAEISEGTLTVGGAVHSNLIPLPFEANGETRLRLLLVDSQSIDIQGTGVTIDVIGHGQPVEDLPPEWAPGETDGTR